MSKKMEIFEEKHLYEFVSHIKTATGWVHNLHWHENYEILEIINKSGNFLIDGEYITAHEGDILVINRRSIHMFIIDDPDFQVRIMQFPLRALLAIDSNILSIKPHIKRSELEKHADLAKLVDSLMVEITKEAPCVFGDTNPYLLSLFCSLYFALASYFPIGTLDDSRKASPLFFETVEYLNDNFRRDDLTIGVIAKNLYVPRERLAKEFLKFAGISLKDYLYRLRINEVNLLISSGTDIGCAALKSGFNNLRTFNTTYKRFTGMTPTEFLESHKKPKASGYSK